MLTWRQGMRPRMQGIRPPASLATSAACWHRGPLATSSTSSRLARTFATGDGEALDEPDPRDKTVHKGKLNKFKKVEFKKAAPQWKKDRMKEDLKLDVRRAERPAEGAGADAVANLDEVDEQDMTAAMRLLSEREERHKLTAGMQFDELSEEDIEDGIPADEQWMTEDLGPKFPTFQQRAAKEPKVYIEQRRVTHHTTTNASKYYEVAEEILAGLPAFCSQRKGFNSELSRKTRFMMIREPGLRVVQIMKDASEGRAFHPSKGTASTALVGLKGMRGSGKSCVLHYAAQFAVENDWLVVGTDGEEFPHDLLGLISFRQKRHAVSTAFHEYSIYNQRKFAQRWFKQLIESQGPKLQKVALKTGTLWDWDDLTAAEAAEAALAAGATAEEAEVAKNDAVAKASKAAAKAEKAVKAGGSAAAAKVDKAGDDSEDTDDVDIDFDYVDLDEMGRRSMAEQEAGEVRLKRLKLQQETGPKRTLLDLCRLAVASPTQTDDIVYGFVAELQVVDELPVLVCVDSLNRWDHKTDFVDPENPFKRLMARQLAMVDAFSVFQTTPPKRGMSLFALSSGGRQLLGKHYLQQCTEVVEVKRYSDTELDHAMRHYFTSGRIASVVDPWFLARVKGLTANIPSDVYKMALLS